MLVDRVEEGRERGGHVLINYCTFTEHFIRNTSLTLAGSSLWSQTDSGLRGLDPPDVGNFPLRFWFHVEVMHHISSADSC